MEDIQPIMQGNGQKSIGGYPGDRQKLQEGKYQHAGADGPDDLQHVGVKIQIDREVDEGQLKEDQPKTAGNQFASHILRRAASLPLQIDGSPRESDESRSTKVRHPPREEER